MQKSLSMLSNVIDFEDKKMQLDGFKNRLEAVVSPKIVQAFTAKDLGNKITISTSSSTIAKNCYTKIQLVFFKSRFIKVVRDNI